MRLPLLAVCTFLTAASLFAQGDRGSLTGTIADPAGAVVANAPIEARNTQTGATYQTASTSTGNYTLSQLPAGTYEMTVIVPGFKKFIRQNMALQVAQVLRVDVALEVGSASESVTVTEAVALLKTESGELSHNVTSERVDNLPILAIGAAAGSSEIRNPQSVAMLLPGTFVQPNSNVRVNGAPGNTASYRLEGQDASNGQVPATQAQVQPSVDAIQEVTIQTSNFSAEYGQVGGGFFNYTVKSGTNRLSGSVYDYFVNEILNANTPWTATAKTVSRKNDYGFTVGGPIFIPKVYNGHDKSFFFFNFEQLRDTLGVSNQLITLPTDAYRQGNFATARLTRTLATDPLGRPVIEGTIYDPSTTRTLASGQSVRDPFANNVIPAAQFDPVSVKIQNLIPAATRTGLVNNAAFPYTADRVTDIPTIKLDHSLGSKAHISYFWQRTRTASQYSQTFGASDGLPTPITAAIGTFIWAHAQRLNFDYTLTPTMLLHLGVGYQDDYFTDDPPVLDYNPEQSLGLKGSTVNRLFPALQGLSNAQGGVKNLGPGSNRHPLLYQKPTANASMTWVKDNHTYKMGGELRLDSNLSYLYTYTNGIYGFSANQTALPYLQTSSTGGGTIGFPYASFLLGTPDSIRIAQLNNIRLGKHQIGLFLQDTWKVTRKFTLDYGVRWDYSTYLKEQYGRLAQFAPEVPNPSAGGHAGAVQFEGSGAGRCNCNFAKVYPYAVGPRLGFAYQINTKTVLRGGWGIVYSGTGDANGATQGGLTAPAAVNSPAFGEPVLNMKVGIPSTLVAPFPNFDIGQYPQKGYATTQAPLVWYDQNAGRPPRQMQWSIGLQREVIRDLVVEASYVANRGVWWYQSNLIDVNALTPDVIKKAGLDVTATADQAILRAQVGSAAARQFQGKLPYAGFPTTATVAQSLRPFPQYNSIVSLWSPLGNTWYDSLQAKVNKRMTHGLLVTGSFTWSKNFATGAASNPVIPSSLGGTTNDVFNRPQNKYLSQFDQPLIFNLALNYTTPAAKLGQGMAGKTLAYVTKDWSINSFLQYSSGLLIQAPAAQNNLTTLLFRGTFANRVNGQPLFTQDLNCHCFDPNKEFVLNPKAWTDPQAGTFGTAAAFYSDYRVARHPVENVGLGRSFRFLERMDLNIRVEFTNIFNRAFVPNPTSTNAGALQTTANGKNTAGFGWINTASVGGTTPRQGTIVARLRF